MLRQVGFGVGYGFVALDCTLDYPNDQLVSCACKPEPMSAVNCNTAVEVSQCLPSREGGKAGSDPHRMSSLETFMLSCSGHGETSVRKGAVIQSRYCAQYAVCETLVRLKCRMIAFAVRMQCAAQ